MRLAHNSLLPLCDVFPQYYREFHICCNCVLGYSIEYIVLNTHQHHKQLKKVKNTSRLVSYSQRSEILYIGLGNSVAVRLNKVLNRGWRHLRHATIGSGSTRSLITWYINKLIIKGTVIKAQLITKRVKRPTDLSGEPTFCLPLHNITRRPESINLTPLAWRLLGALLVHACNSQVGMPEQVFTIVLCSLFSGSSSSPSLVCVLPVSKLDKFLLIQFFLSVLVAIC